MLSLRYFHIVLLELNLKLCHSRAPGFLHEKVSLFLQPTPPADQRNSAAGTAAASSALSGSVTATLTVPTTRTNCR